MQREIAIISAGAMGAAVASRLTSHGLTVLTSLKGRSSSTRERALKAGMKDVPFSEIPKRASCFLSILPPSEAEELAKQYLTAYNGSPHPEKAPVYVDCNAISPTTVKRIAALFDSEKNRLPVRFVDAGIIGGPPRKGYDPTFYASSDDGGALEEFESLKDYGLKVDALRGEGAGVGDASALKMSYAGITKGITGLFTTMVLSAHASSPTTSNALMNELSLSQPVLLQRLTRTIPDMLPKAYRWIGEMREISEFVSGEEGKYAGMGNVHEGMASVYERIEKAVNEDGEDKEVLERFVEDAKGVLKKREEEKGSS